MSRQASSVVSAQTTSPTNPGVSRQLSHVVSKFDFDISEVPDPYYGGADGFEKVYQMIDRACEAIAKKLT